MSIFRQLVRRTLSLTLPRTRFFTRGPRLNNALYLTFDDGPHPEYTPRLLDVLADLNIRATFFVVGQNAEKHPDIVRRIVAEGHAIGNHTYSHTRAEQTSARALLEDAYRCSAALSATLGRTPTLFRPPYGHLNVGKVAGLLRAHLTIALWTQDPRDYAASDAATLQKSLSNLRLRAGDVLLLHDIHPHAIAALPAFVATAMKNSFTFAVLPEANVPAAQPKLQPALSK